MPAQDLSVHRPPVTGSREPARAGGSSDAEADAGDCDARSRAARLREIVDQHYDFLWRSLLNLGVRPGDAEDAAQQVLCVVARRLDAIAPEAEKAFLFGAAVRIASEARRAARRRPAIASDVDHLTANAPSAEELVDEVRARQLLGQVLDALPPELRVVFVLFELEELGLAEVAELVGIPVGTVSSRLRRAREQFRALVRRMHARGGRPRGNP